VPIMPKLASFLASVGEGSPPALASSPMRGDSKGIGVFDASSSYCCCC
jgi:hypothetical protein